MLQVGTITYLMITDKILILHLEISTYTAYTGYKVKIEKDMFLEGYIHLIQPIYIRVQISTHQRFCVKVIFYVVYLRKVGTLRTLVKENIEKATFCKEYVHYIQPIYIMLQVSTNTHT